MSTQYERPHYIYISRDSEGKRALTLMTKKGETVAEPLTHDSAMKWARDFLAAAIELRKLELTQGGNNELVQPSGNGSSSHVHEGGLQTDTSVPKGEPSIREG